MASGIFPHGWKTFLKKKEHCWNNEEHSWDYLTLTYSWHSATKKDPFTTAVYIHSSCPRVREFIWAFTRLCQFRGPKGPGTQHCGTTGALGTILAGGQLMPVQGRGTETLKLCCQQVLAPPSSTSTHTMLQAAWYNGVYTCPNNVGSWTSGTSSCTDDQWRKILAQLHSSPWAKSSCHFPTYWT